MGHMHAWATSSMIALGLAIAAPGHAEPAREASDPGLWIGGDLGLSPLGTRKVDALGMSTSSNAATAYEIGGRLEVRLLPFLSIGAAPAVLLHVQGSTDGQPASQLDLPVRITAGSEIAPKLRLYGFTAPGYTVRLSSDRVGNSMASTHASGFLVGLGGGVRVRVAPRFAIDGELGYQLRFVTETRQIGDRPFDAPAQDRFLTFTVAAMMGL